MLADLVSWAKCRAAPRRTPDELWAYFETAFHDFREFRSLVDFRLRGQGGFAKRLPAWPRANDLYLFCDRIGGGFRIRRGHSAWAPAKAIGENFHVNQNVFVNFDVAPDMAVFPAPMAVRAKKPLA